MIIMSFPFYIPEYILLSVLRLHGLFYALGTLNNCSLISNDVVDLDVLISVHLINLRFSLWNAEGHPHSKNKKINKWSGIDLLKISPEVRSSETNKTQF